MNSCCRRCLTPSENSTTRRAARPPRSSAFPANTCRRIGLGFCKYMTSALQSDMLGVNAATREMARRLQNGAGLKVRPPFWYRALTTELLPPRFREEFGFAYGGRERSSASRATRWLRRIYPRLPASLRFVGPYNEVQSRLNGCPRPSRMIRLSNKLWIGQPSLLISPDQS